MKTFASSIAASAAALLVAVAAPAQARDASGDSAWLPFACDAGRTVSVRYLAGATPKAQIRLHKRSRIVTLRQTHSGADNEQAVFEGGKLRWSVDSPNKTGSVWDAGNGFLTRAERQVVNGRRMKVDAIVRKGCERVR